MKNLLVINGVNLNMLGIREKNLYGEKTYEDLLRFIRERAIKANVNICIEQSNYEGHIVNLIQGALGKYDGIIINAGAYTHTSIAILDALKAVSIPTVEVHITDIDGREEFRRISYVSMYAEKVIKGHGFEGYGEAIDYLAQK